MRSSGLANDEDLGPAPAGFGADLVDDELADDVYAEVEALASANHGVVVVLDELSVDQVEVGVGAGLGEAAVVATTTGGEARLAVGRFRLARLGAEQEHGQGPGEGFLADAIGAVEEVGVRQPLGGQGPLDEALGAVLVLDVKTRHGPGPPELWRGPRVGWGVRR